MGDFLKIAARLIGVNSKKTKGRTKGDCPSEKEEEGERMKQEKEEREKEKEEEKEKWGKELKNKGKLFVGGLNPRTTSKDLEIYFSRFGKVLDCIVMRYPKTSKSRGFGFVTFSNPADAESVMKAHHLLDGRVIELRPFGRKNLEEKDPFRIFLGGIPYTATANDLKEFFERYGQVLDIEVPFDKNTKEPKGYAFLSFKEKEALEKCISEGFVHIGGKRVQIKKAEPRNRSGGNYDGGSTCGGSQEEDFDVERQSVNSAESAYAVTGDAETQSSSSGGQYSQLDQDFKFQRLLDFLLTVAGGSDKVKEVNPKEEIESPQDKEKGVANVEKMLLEMFLSSGTKVTGAEEDFICFSTEEEDEESDEDSSDSDISDESTNPCSVINNLDRENSELLLTTKGLSCAPCQWQPLDGSAETFFTHCQTPTHRLKIQERFIVNSNKRNKPETKTFFPINDHLQHMSKSIEKPNNPEKQVNLQSKQCGKPKQTQIKQPQHQRSKHQKEHNEQQSLQLQEKHRKQQQNQVQQEKKTKTKKKESKELKTKTSVPTEQGRKKISNLKVHALAKGMVSIRPLPGGKLHCTMCNKSVPQAQEFDVLMKNLSQHLLSKKHLQNLSITENSLENALNGNLKQQKRGSGVSNNKAPKDVQKAKTTTQKHSEKNKGNSGGQHTRKVKKNC